MSYALIADQYRLGEVGKEEYTMCAGGLAVWMIHGTFVGELEGEFVGKFLAV